jgi:adenylosuccinate synthase
MPATIILGTQWGDEGKGKIVDFYAEKADLVVRFQGGNNAGHTVIVGDKTFKLHFIPSGVIYGKEVLLGNGMVINPETFIEELRTIKDMGLNPNFTISNRATVITGKHIAEDSKDTKIGTTKKGIGPAYADKINRKGLRFCDIVGKYPELDGHIGDVSFEINKALAQNKQVLFEGAQGTFLDIDHGTYPFVTSSNTTAGGACTGAGVGPTKIDHVLGVVKAYTTRVGEGPFPTELEDETGKHLLEKGHEFGTTTGRPRRCGWFDAVLLNYSVRVNGIDSLAITKLDVLSGLDKVKICTHYDCEGETITEFPASLEKLGKCKPVYIELKGWTEQNWSEIVQAGYDAIPQEAKDYTAKIEQLCSTEVKTISVGPKRTDTILI